MKIQKTQDKWSYPSFQEWEWRSYDGKNKINIDEFLTKNSDDSIDFYIGTDSQTYGHKVIMTTVLIAYKKRHGGSIITHAQKLPRFESLRQRLLGEAMRSLETAWYINPKIRSDSLVIHLDVNANLKYKSGQYKDELVGMIMAQNFKVSVKPNAWASSNVADSKV